MANAHDAGETSTRLELIHQPPGFAQMDIVLVHGFGGEKRHTWTKSLGKESYFWPDWIAEDTALKSARVYLFGYKALKNWKPYRKSIAEPSDFARQLLGALGKRDQSIPIIFVAHSLGGIIVKEAYNISKTDGQFLGRINDACGIMFLGTPHKGASLAGKAVFLLKASGFRRQTESYIRVLRKDSEALQTIHSTFLLRAGNLFITSCYETLRTGSWPLSAFIVKKKSAVLDMDGEYKIPMDKDHRDLARYTDLDDPDLQELFKHLELFRQSVGWWKRGVQIPERSKESLIRELLGTECDPSEDLDFFRKKRARNTCVWIEMDSQFREWFSSSDSSSSRTLWLHGVPGSGKSVLASYIVSYIKDTCGVPCQYFFFREGNVKRQSLSSLVASLAAQLAGEFRQFRSHLVSLADSGYRLGHDADELLWRKLIADVLPLLDYKRSIYWIVDGLDLCPSARTFLAGLANGFMSKVPLRILVLSCYSSAIFEASRDLGAIPMNLDRIEGKRKDVRLYVEAQLGKTHPHIDAIYKSTEGNFLEAQLVTSDVHSSFSENGVANALGRTRPEFDLSWNKILLRLAAEWKGDERSIAQGVLTWVSYCKFPLTTNQIAVALRLDEFKWLDQSRICQLCLPLVEVDNESRVRLSHRTVRRYLTGAKGNNLIPDSAVAHSKLLEICLKALVEAGVNGVDSYAQPGSLYEYAATSWDYHLSESAIDNDTAFWNRLEDFLGGPAVILWIFTLAKKDQLLLLVSASAALIRLKMKGNHPSDQAASHLLTQWATELTMVWGNFGDNLRRYPQALYETVPAFCPKASLIRCHFEEQYAPLLVSVRGLSAQSWSEIIAGVPAEKNQIRVLSTNQHIALIGQNSVRIVSAVTYCDVRDIRHAEIVRGAQFSNSGHMLVTYGFQTLKVWLLDNTSQHWTFNVPTDYQILDMAFTHDDTSVLCCLADGSIWRYPLKLGTDSAIFSDFVRPKGETGVSMPPICAAFSRGARLLAASFRNNQTQIWDMSRQYKLRRRPLHVRDQDDPLSTIRMIRWTPSDGGLIIVFSDTSAWMWSLENNTLRRIAKCAVDDAKSSPTGSFLVSCDKRGIFTVLDTHSFSTVHRFNFGQPLVDFDISPDGCKVRILCRRSCHTWMPECLIRLSSAVKHSDRDLRLATEGGSASDNASASVSEPIEILAVGPRTGVYCTAHTGGGLRIGEATGNTLLSLPPPYYTFIRHVAWSEDERFLAIADEKYLWIYEVQCSAEPPEVKYIARSEIQETPYEILFCDHGESVLISGKSSLYLWHYRQNPQGTLHSVFQGFRRWISHPHRTDLLLGFDAQSVIVFSLLDLTHSTPLILSVSDASEGGELTHMAQNSANGATREYTVAKLFVRNDGLQLLIQATEVSNAGNFWLLVMDTADLDMAHLQGRPKVEVLKPPQAILDKISKVLGFIDHSMFGSSLAAHSEGMVIACLDHNGNFCTIHNGSALQKHPLFLPRHWLNAKYLDMSQVTKGGTILIPTDGEVAAIRYGRRYDSGEFR